MQMMDLYRVVIGFQGDSTQEVLTVAHSIQ